MEGATSQEMEGITSQENNITVVNNTKVVAKPKPPEYHAMNILSDWCSYRSLPTPKYALDHTGGQPHCPSFTFTVTVGDLSASGTGRSKRSAKMIAAQALLDEVAMNISHENGSGISSDEPMDREREKNSVGKLQELCIGRGWPLPVFDNAQVVITCKIEGQEVTGYGLKRKNAKQAAADNMMKLLKNLPTQESWRTGV